MIPAVILAAGLSTRMGGRTKALLPLPGGDTFLTRIIRTLAAAGVDDIVAVIGHERDAVRRTVDEVQLPVRLLVNERYPEGQFSSLLAGLDAINRPGVDAMLMTLVDVPLVTVATVMAVRDRYRERRPPITRPVRGLDHGHPIVIDRSLFSALRSADASRGAKPIVRAHVSDAGDVPVDDAGAFADVDTPEAYTRLIGLPL